MCEISKHAQNISSDTWTHRRPQDWHLICTKLHSVVLGFTASTFWPIFPLGTKHTQKEMSPEFFCSLIVWNIGTWHISEGKYASTKKHRRTYALLVGEYSLVQTWTTEKDKDTANSLSYAFFYNGMIYRVSLFFFWLRIHSLPQNDGMCLLKVDHFLSVQDLCGNQLPEIHCRLYVT